MTYRLPSPGRVLLLLLGSLAALLPAGCREAEGITSYTQHPPATAESPEAEPEVEARVRLLAAILPRGEQAWFFKLVGPVAAVSAQEQTFDEFLASIRFPDDGKKIAWRVPEGWREEPGKGMRYATFRMGAADVPLELSVSQASGSLGDNINRWRRQDLGLPELRRFSKGVRELKTDAGKMYRIDMSGPGGKGPMKPPVGQ